MWKALKAVASRQPTTVERAENFPAASSSQTSRLRNNASFKEPVKDVDLMTRIKGMYRLLSLYKEQGSAEKVLIGQESLGALMNKLVPLSYHSITRINFASLDETSIQPLGIYGDKSAIVDFLYTVADIDYETAAHLLNPSDLATTSPSRLTLVSGLYFLLPTIEPSSTNQKQSQPGFVIYWPEDTTWNDNAIGAVCRNRTTFMRYLTKLTPQIRSLISKDHADAIVWKGVDQELNDANDYFGDENDDDEENQDRYFKFEVSKTTEQEEGAEIFPGFVLAHPAIETTAFPEGANVPQDISCSLIETKLLLGDCKQGFLASRFLPYQKELHSVDNEFSAVGLRSYLEKHPNISLGTDLTEEGLWILLEDGGLLQRASGLINSYKERRKAMQIAQSREFPEALKEIKSKFEKNRYQLAAEIRFMLAQAIANIHPHLSIYRILDRPLTDEQHLCDDLEYLQGLVTQCPSILAAQNSIISEAKFDELNSKSYSKMKGRFLKNRGTLTRYKELSTQDQADLLNSILGIKELSKSIEVPGSWLGGEWDPADHPEMSDDAFFQLLDKMARQIPELGSFLDSVRAFAYRWAIKKLDKFTPKFLESITRIFDRESEAMTMHLTKISHKREQEDLYTTFKTDLQQKLLPNPDALILIVNEVLRKRPGSFTSYVYHLNAQSESFSDPCMEYTIHLLDLKEDERGRMEEDPQFIPNPSTFAVATFTRPVKDSIRHIQAIENKYLLIVDQTDGIMIWLGSPYRIGRDNPTRQFSGSKRKYLFAVNEQQRLLAIVYIEENQVFLQLQSMDEALSTLRALGNPQNMTAWYQNPSGIEHICFAGGAEELCIIESSGRIRIYSFVSQAFRGSTLQLAQGVNVHSVYSAPDDSALIIVERTPSRDFQLRLYHWDSFGKYPKGITLKLPGESGLMTSFCASSVVQKSGVVVIGLVPEFNTIRCFNLQIKSKNTAYRFKSVEGKSQKTLEGTIHNSLIDCHAEVWRAYPVVSAIKRETITPYGETGPCITFVCHLGSRMFSTYFKRMIRDFDNLTKKPTDGVLDSIKICASKTDDLDWNTLEAGLFKAGEWFVELLCLIPIHIAVARHGVFTPLKDGILDSYYEQSMHGATVDRITESITLGWYESILNSYMATKPVKVVSSMGEQSVGKSYMLNHIIDSSFAGSALRTTEGVWLSICPTSKALVVALDFEGVHSVERSQQEDMLLVHFNTAISNLVLFRNNFALTRDVANMFTSFQASTTLLNPKLDQRLFKGQLAIIIKDVVAADKKEIVNEFTSKFRQIVSDEQEANFISVLHAARLCVFPWPVIQSRQFYTLFSQLKTVLFQQPTTHASAGEFLITLKTLMAKLKANDWTAIDENLTKHRVALLTVVLSCALETGFSELHPEREELKNLDNQDPIPWGDDSHDVTLCLSKHPEDRISPLSALVNRWKADAARYDVVELSKYLECLVAARISHVQEWINVNTSRFQEQNEYISSLKIMLAEKEYLLREGVQLCRIKCSHCHLSCLLPKHSTPEHDCQTNHQCLETCDYIDQHTDDDDETMCGLAAAHGGPHLCKQDSHSCGNPCGLVQLRGCEETCVNIPGHYPEEGHFCSAKVHQCGKLCSLQGAAVTGNQGTYSCPNFCTAPYDENHENHVCGDRPNCPIKCQLCNRLCTMGDHLHGLKDEVHLCGQKHPCLHDCESPGICKIESEPLSVESTFSGIHGKFQFTKYTQIARRLTCAIPIAPGKLIHAGTHVHKAESDVFHYCETKCKNCGYFCILPLNHHQKEHETVHGSMQNTLWAVEGSGEATVEIQGRKYAAQDSGTPNICSSVCRELGRHAHIDYCQSTGGNCQLDGLHISEKMSPNPDAPKDWISHKLFWQRTGFKDPYSREEKEEFSRCDIQCADKKHKGTATVAARPSFCTLGIFHPPKPVDWTGDGNGYVSADGHSFGCENPNVVHQALHVILVLDASFSMNKYDLQPLSSTPNADLIVANHNNRFGAVLSALDGFLHSRSNAPKKDSYSVITFGWNAPVIINDDSTSTPWQILNELVKTWAYGVTNFDNALQATKETMEAHWSSDRAPAVIFLSDGESDFTDDFMDRLCNTAVRRGKPLSFHAILFGSDLYSESLKRMVNTATRIANNAPRDPPRSPAAPCGYSNAMDTIKLADTFLSIAESLKKPRASLMRSS